MRTKDQSRLASFLALLVGVWIILSPAWMSMSSGAVTSAIIVGAVVIVASVVQYFTEYAVPSWILGLSAVWLFISSFTLSSSVAAGWSQIISAIIIVGLAYWDGVEVMHLQSSRHHHAAL